MTLINRRAEKGIPTIEWTGDATLSQLAGSLVKALRFIVTYLLKIWLERDNSTRIRIQRSSAYRSAFDEVTTTVRGIVQGIDGPLPAHLPGPSCKYNGLAALYTTFYSQLWFYVQNLSQIG
jgi:hypothetical protein